jgi:hypothetical protein
MCIGTRIFVRRIIERIYYEASQNAKIESKSIKNSSSNNINIESTRRLLGHPNAVYPNVQCIVVSVNGFDLDSISNRAMVASYLWAAGISAEYVAQSGVMMNLLKQTKGANSLGGEKNVSDKCDRQNRRYYILTKLFCYVVIKKDWRLDELEKICSLFQIPFLVIVQDHLLREKESVRLRMIPHSKHLSTNTVNSSTNEENVPVLSLASFIKDRLLSTNSFHHGFDVDLDDTKMLFDSSSTRTMDRQQDTPSLHKHTSPSSSSSSVTNDMDCIYVDIDQFYREDNISVSNKDKESKQRKRMFKTCIQRVEEQLNSTLLSSSSTHKHEGCTLLTINLPFMIIRDFSSAAMFGNKSKPIMNVLVESGILTKHKSHSKLLKTLAMSLDHLIRVRRDLDDKMKALENNNNSSSRNIGSSSASSSNNRGQSSNIFSALIFSIGDDRFDFFQYSL